MFLHPHAITKDRATRKRTRRIDGEHAHGTTLRPKG
jgi:hypothetical protein